MTYKFNINNQTWTVKEYEGRTFQEEYNRILKEYNGEVTEHEYYKGFCDRINHVIGINISQCEDEILNTLRHELIHCYLMMTGHIDDIYSEEKLCDIYVFARNFVENAVTDYVNAQKKVGNNDDRGGL